MEYTTTIDMGVAGDVDVTIDVDDESVAQYAVNFLDMIDEDDTEDWTHSNIPLSDWLDNEDDPDAALDWVLKNIPHETIIKALEKELGG